MLTEFFYYFLPEISHEQEEPDSAFEATQYFFEDITPETSIGKNRRHTILFHLTAQQTFYWTFSVGIGIGSSNHFDCPPSTGHDSKCRSEKDDGFVRVTFKTEKGERHSRVLQNVKASV